MIRMIRWALTFIVNRLLFMAILLLALNAYSQTSSCQYGNSQGVSRALAGMQDAYKALSNSFR